MLMKKKKIIKFSIILSFVSIMVIISLLVPRAMNSDYSIDEKDNSSRQLETKVNKTVKSNNASDCVINEKEKIELDNNKTEEENTKNNNDIKNEEEQVIQSNVVNQKNNLESTDQRNTREKNDSVNTKEEEKINKTTNAIVKDSWVQEKIDENREQINDNDLSVGSEIYNKLDTEYIYGLLDEGLSEMEERELKEYIDKNLSEDEYITMKQLINKYSDLAE